MVAESEKQQTQHNTQIGTDFTWKHQLVWQNVLVHVILNSSCLYSIYVMATTAQWRTNVWVFGYGYLTNVGVAVGAHRLYTHRTFKATYMLRLVLILLQTAAGQNSMLTWVRDHRQHHKFSDTDADPHNATRGFFYSHMGWLLVKKHPKVIAAGKKLDLSDLKADSLVLWQKKYYVPLYIVFALVVPLAIPMYYWNETLWNSFFVVYIFRYVVSLHLTWLVNSAAHKLGMRPYNKDILPVETTTWIGCIMVGEQYHNYHHTFPSDYRASDLGMKLNFSALVIETMAFLGLAYDLHTTPKQSIKQRITKTGDGSYTSNDCTLSS